MPLDYSADPLGPFRPGTFGANTLVLSHTAVAILDLPNPQFVADVRRRLLPGESWRVRVDVHATVTRENATVDQYRDPEDESNIGFWTEYGSHMRALRCVELFNGFKICMGNNQNAILDSNDQTWLFLAHQPAGVELDEQTEFHSAAKMFATWREAVCRRVEHHTNNNAAIQCRL